MHSDKTTVVEKRLSRFKDITTTTMLGTVTPIIYLEQPITTIAAHKKYRNSNPYANCNLIAHHVA